MKKIVAMLLTVVMVFALVGCGSKKEKAADDSKEVTNQGSTQEGSGDENPALDSVDAGDVKVGFIYIGDENDGYTYAFYEGALEMKKALGISDENFLIKWNVPENEVCYEAACELVDDGCDIIFANSYGHETYMMQAAEENPDVEFCSATGDMAKKSGIDNYHNYYVSVEQSRYVSGIVAGMKLNEMIADGKITEDQAVVGYVGAFAFAQVISGFDSFYLGVKSVCPAAKMIVKYTSTWGDQAIEYDVAKALIEESKCVLISQHSNTTGPAAACEELGVYCVGYNISMIDAAPNYALTSASLNWGPFTTYAVKCVAAGEKMPSDWCKGYEDGACKITEVNAKAFSAETYSEVMAAVETAESALKEGSLQVFDTTTFTVGGNALTEDFEDSFGAKPVFDGAFHESYFQSAPGAAFIIDGITELD